MSVEKVITKSVSFEAIMVRLNTGKIDEIPLFYHLLTIDTMCSSVAGYIKSFMGPHMAPGS